MVSVPKIGKYNIIFADYEDGKLSDFDIEPVVATEDKTGEITQTCNEEIVLEPGDKIMLWNDISDIMPVCEVFNVE